MNRPAIARKMAALAAAILALAVYPNQISVLAAENDVAAEVAILESDAAAEYNIELYGEETAPSGTEALTETEAAAADVTEGTEDLNVTTKNQTWTGPVLSKKAGAVFGPAEKEVYYNLNMETVAANLQAAGYEGEYWVRDDGVKMFGRYVMCAAAYSLHPYGSLVETSLGTAIVCDTGGFAYSYPHLLDIAVTW